MWSLVHQRQTNPHARFSPCCVPLASLLLRLLLLLPLLLPALPLSLLLLLLLLQFSVQPPALSADLEVPIFDYGLVTFLGTFFPGLVF